MRGLVAVLYFMALGYLFAKTKLDEAAAATARQWYRALVRETVSVYREIDAGPPAPLAAGEIHRLEGPCHD